MLLWSPSQPGHEEVAVIRHCYNTFDGWFETENSVILDSQLYSLSYTYLTNFPVIDDYVYEL